MAISPTLAERWLFAAKLGSWSKTLAPAWLGIALGANGISPIGPWSLLLALVHVAALTLTIVFLNDWADVEVDTLKRRLFPQTSRKTIPDRVLSAPALLRAGYSCGAIAIASATVLTLQQNSLGPLICGLCGLAIFWAYSLPPLRLNYRGGGEWCETIGIALILPLFGASAVGGSWTDVTTWSFLPALIGLAWASAAASGLADESSDRLGGKQTYAVRLGNVRVRAMVSGAWLLSACAIGGGIASVRGWPHAVAGGLAALVVVCGYLRMRKLSPSAVRDDFGGIRHYKQIVNDSITWALLAWSLGGVLTQHT